MNENTIPPPAPDDRFARGEASRSTALDVVDALTVELRRLGVTLPSLGLDLPSYTVTTAPRPLIELGRVNLTTATRLVRVLRTARADSV